MNFYFKIYLNPFVKDVFDGADETEVVLNMFSQYKEVAVRLLHPKLLDLKANISSNKSHTQNRRSWNAIASSVTYVFCSPSKKKLRKLRNGNVRIHNIMVIL
jgi:hypothetical protein